MEHHPAHIEGFVRGAAERFPEGSDAYHFYFQVLCPCGEPRLQVYTSNKKSVKVQCGRCGKQITVYDLIHYPAASKMRGSREFYRAAGTPGNVYVMYEYGERDEDEEFNRNDITWCQVWIEDDAGALTMLLDDETA